MWIGVLGPVSFPSLGKEIIQGLDTEGSYSLIHGGAWHDPCITSRFADKAVTLLQHSKSSTEIDGIASLNYRLSPWATHPTNPSNPDDTSRQARHPDHVEDLVGGIRYLQARFGFRDRYILAGHSCGATIAYQALAYRMAHESRDFVPPQAIVGIAGLYDLVLLRNMDPEPPVCQDFLSAAFGADEAIWREQSPVNGNYGSLWPDGRIAVLAICREDEYVSPRQREEMVTALRAWEDGIGRFVETLDLDGSHDEVWKKGVGLTNCIEEAISVLLRKSTDRA